MQVIFRVSYIISQEKPKKSFMQGIFRGSYCPRFWTLLQHENTGGKYAWEVKWCSCRLGRLILEWEAKQ